MRSVLPDAAARRRARWLCLGLALLALAGSALFAARFPVATGGDAAAYALAARYDPLVDNFDNPSHGWGYPAVMAVIAPLLGDDYRAGQAISIAACALFVFAAAALALRFLPFAAAALVGLLIATHPAVLRLGGAAMSDMLFAALVVGAIALAFRPAPSAAALLAAGACALFACFVRGNGIVLVPLLPLLLFARAQGSARAAGLFLAGSGACLALAALLFAAQGLPPGKLLRSGAGELAFAALDQSDTWLHRPEWDARFPSYGVLLREHSRELVVSAARTLLHLHDWWLIPTLGLFGVFTVPGLLLCLRRSGPIWPALLLPFLALWATFLWSGRFRESRHLLAVLPLLFTASWIGLGLLPRRRRVPLVARPLPLRAAVLALATALSLGYSAYAVYALVAHGGTRPRELEQREAGLFLREQGAKPDERIAGTRLTTAYYARLFPLDYSEVFGRETAALSPADVCRLLREHDTRWLVWIESHGQFEHPGMTWLEEAESFAGCALVFRKGHVSVWRVDEPDL